MVDVPLTQLEEQCSVTPLHLFDRIGSLPLITRLRTSPAGVITKFNRTMTCKNKLSPSIIYDS